MVRDSKIRTVTAWIFLLAILVWAVAVTAGAGEKTSVAMITCIKKELLVTHEGAQKKGKVGMDLYEGDLLTTGPGCQAVIMLGDGSELKLNEKTGIKITAYNAKQKSIFVQMGEIFGKFLPQKTKVTIETPQGVAGIEGTELCVKVDKDASDVTVGEGKVTIGEKGNVLLTKGEKALWSNSKDLRKMAGQLPPWIDEVRDYSLIIKEIFEKHPENSNVKRLSKMSEQQVKDLLDRQEKILAELKVVTPPDKVAQIHENLIKTVEQSVTGLKTCLACKENPRDRALKKQFTRELGEYLSSWKDLTTELKPFIQEWKEFKEQFIKNYSSRMSTR